MEGKSISYVVGLCAGIAVSVLVLTLLRKRRGGASNEYDERQVLVRGKAFGTAFFTLMCYLALNAAVCTICGPWAVPGIDGLLGIFLGVGVFLLRAIEGDAYFSLRENPRFFRILCLVVIACQLPNILMSLRQEDERFFTDGLLNSNCLSIACTIVFAAAFIAIGIHEKRRSGEEDGEDE